MMRTPDALLSGETTVSLFESCVPSIVDGWEVTTLDTDLLLVAIRIASNGEFLAVTHVCSNPECQKENDYDISLTNVIDHFNNCTYNNTIKLKDLTIKIQPLTYRQSTDFSLVNYDLQQQMSVAIKIENEQERKVAVTTLFKELGKLQNDIYTASIESIDTGTTVVTEKKYIKDWISNCDKIVFAQLKEHFNSNKEIWRIPTVKVQCDCGTSANLSVDLDQSSFFVTA